MDNKENQIEELKKEIEELNKKINELEKREKYNTETFESTFLDLYKKVTRKKSERNFCYAMVIVYIAAIALVVMIHTGQLNDIIDVMVCLIIAIGVMVTMLVWMLVELRYLIPEIITLIKQRRRRKQDSKNDMGDKQ